MSADANLIPNSYWVIPDKFMAGEHFGAYDAELQKENVNWLLDQGLTFIVNLTERPEYYPYEQILGEEAKKRGLEVVCVNFPIKDMSTPPPEMVVQILDSVDTALAEGHGVYLHCLAGLGRTGTLVGCYLVRHGRSGEAALAQLDKLREQTKFANYKSPQTTEQCDLVRNWVRGQ